VSERDDSSPLDWLSLPGEYDFLTDQPEGSRGPGPPFQSVLRLELVDNPKRLIGSEQYTDDRGRTFTQPATFADDQLLIGDPAAEGGPSQYRIEYLTPDGFGGVWRTFQPGGLRARQPHTPEWVQGTFSARRR
jgi:hypothetical protein